MKENTQDKSLVQANKNGIFNKISQFFKKIFGGNNVKNDNSYTVDEEIKDKIKNKDEKNSFIKSIKNIEDEETKLLKLQKRYSSGEIKEEELTSKQVEELCALYDKQITDLKKSNDIKKQKLIEYKSQREIDN